MLAARFNPLQRRGRWLAAVVAIFAMTAVSPASAEVAVSAQATAANAGWLAYAPAPAAPAAVCLVDTGVSLQADTAPVVTRRVARDGGTLDDVDAVEGHGTLMAMVAAAPANGQGMIGIAPQAVRVVSVRTAEPPAPGERARISFDSYGPSTRECTKYVQSDRVAVVNLSFGTRTEPSEQQKAELEDRVVAARAAGLSIVAGAGNDSSEGAIWPARMSGVVGVGAVGSSRGACDFSAFGSGVDLWSPGCQLDTANPWTLAGDTTQGTSQASALTSAVLAALRAYRPELTNDESEQLLVTTARNGVLDVEAAFRAAGLGQVVDAGRAQMPTPQPASTPVSSAGTTPMPAATATATPSPSKPPVSGVGEERWARPTVRSVRWRKGVLEVRVSSRLPRDASVYVSAQRRTARRWVTLKQTRGAKSVLRMKLRSRPARVAVRLADVQGYARDSAVRYVTRIGR